MGLIDKIVDLVVGELTGAILLRLDALRAQIGDLMETVESVQAKLEAINSAIAAERTEVQDLIGGLRQQIQDLQNQIGQGQLVTQEQLDGLGAAADAIVDRVRAISEPIAA